MSRKALAAFAESIASVYFYNAIYAGDDRCRHRLEPL
jgi:hypothetical protein